MTPRDIITGLRAAGVCPLLPRESGRILRTGGRRDLLESAHALPAPAIPASTLRPAIIWKSARAGMYASSPSRRRMALRACGRWA